MTDTSLGLLLAGAAAAAFFLDRLFPANKGRGWNNSRAATQRDVAEVLRGRKGASQPDTTGLVIFLFVLYGWFALIYGP
jgi:hypothetical protein